METLIKILNKKGLKFTRRIFEFNHLLVSENEDISKEINKYEFEKDYVLYSLKKWLREKRNIHIEIIGFVSGDLEVSYSYWIRNLKEYSKVIVDEVNYDSYEKCLEQALLKVLQMI